MIWPHCSLTTVVRNICHKEVNRLPGKTILCDMMLECLTIAQAQLGEELDKTDVTTTHYKLMELPSMVATLPLMISQLLIIHILLVFDMWFCTEHIRQAFGNFGRFKHN